MLKLRLQLLVLVLLVLQLLFFALKYTHKKIVMLERYKLAHGATGHNAGQVVSYFERGFASLVDEFGIERAAQGQKALRTHGF